MTSLIIYFIYSREDIVILFVPFLPGDIVEKLIFQDGDMDTMAGGYHHEDESH